MFDVGKFKHFHGRTFFFSLFSYYFHSHRFTHGCVQRSWYICFPIFIFFVRAEWAYIIYKFSQHIDRRKGIPFELKWRHSNTYIYNLYAQIYTYILRIQIHINTATELLCAENTVDICFAIHWHIKWNT